MASGSRPGHASRLKNNRTKCNKQYYTYNNKTVAFHVRTRRRTVIRSVCVYINTYVCTHILSNFSLLLLLFRPRPILFSLSLSHAARFFHVINARCIIRARVCHPAALPRSFQPSATEISGRTGPDNGHRTPIPRIPLNVFIIYVYYIKRVCVLYTNTCIDFRR